MPSTSKKQRNFMAAVAHSPAFAKKVGVPQSVGKDFNAADKGKKFGSGGTARTDILIKSKRGDDMATKMMKFEKSGKDMETKGKGKEGSKKEEAFDRAQMMGMKKGGAVKASPMAKVKTAAPSRDGVATKGKTKGTQIKMAGSGVPNGIGSKVMKKGGRTC